MSFINIDRFESEDDTVKWYIRHAGYDEQLYLPDEEARDLVYLLARRLGYLVIDPAAVTVFGQSEDIRRIKQEDGK